MKHQLDFEKPIAELQRKLEDLTKHRDTHSIGVDFQEEVALMEQPFIKDETKKVKDIVGPNAQIVGFYRWQVGETA